MSDEETTQPTEESKEEVFEFVGAGFIPGVPGLYANCRVVVDPETKEVLKVEPLEGAAWTLAPAEPAKPAQPVEQPTNQSQGG